MEREYSRRPRDGGHQGQLARNEMTMIRGTAASRPHLGGKETRGQIVGRLCSDPCARARHPPEIRLARRESTRIRSVTKHPARSDRGGCRYDRLDTPQ